MKKSYETPTVEKIKFNYRDQVVAASGAGPVPEPDESWQAFLTRLLADGFGWDDIVEIWNKYVV